MPGTPGVNGCALSCLVVNVNGMRSRNKRRGLFQRLRDLHYSIVVLCETHSKDDRETTRWAQEGAGPGLPWEGQAFWNHGIKIQDFLNSIFPEVVKILNFNNT